MTFELLNVIVHIGQYNVMQPVLCRMLVMP